MPGGTRTREHRLENLETAHTHIPTELNQVIQKHTEKKNTTIIINIIFNSNFFILNIYTLIKIYK